MRMLHVLVTLALLPAALPACAQTADDGEAIRRIEAGSTAHPYAQHVAEAARRFGIPEAWIWDVIRVESGGNPIAVSRAGAMGLMQLMPATWTSLRAQLKLGDHPFDAHDNILVGSAYLRAMHDRYGNRAAMLAAYNAGPGRYDDYLLRGRPLPLETRNYLNQLTWGTDIAVDVRHTVASYSDPLAWRSGALFVRSATNTPITSANGVVDAAGRAGALRHDRNTSDTFATQPFPARLQSDALFVRRAGARQSQ